MKLHDPDTEKELIHIARNVVGPEGFVETGFVRWALLFRKVLVSGAVVYVLAIVLAFLSGEVDNAVVRQVVFAALMMALIRLGQGRIAVAFQSAGFFGTLANLPVRSRTALTHIRGIVIRRFWFISVIGPFLAATGLHFPVDPEKSPAILTTWALLGAMVWATLGIAQVRWIRSLQLARIWTFATGVLAAYIVLLYLFGGRPLVSQWGLTALDHLIGGILWILPPAWVFPDRVAAGGLIPAIIWIAWGFWCWMRWPSTAFSGYDRPHDLVGAFGHVGMPEKIDVAEILPDSGEDSIALEPTPQPSSTGWVERMIAAAIPAGEQAVAGSLMAATNHSRPVNATMVFAVIWLLLIGFGKDRMLETPYLGFFIMAAWIVPAIVFALGLLPIGDPLKPAMQVCQAGNNRVPIFSMLPVALRSMLRITLRIVIVRTVIAVAIATPFFWLLAKILGFADVGGAILAMIPAIGVAWILSVPAFLANRFDTFLRRRKGIFPLILATALVQVPIGFLWIISGVAGVGLMLLWSQGSEAGKHAFLLLPAALGCFALSGVMSWLIFEILHLSLRQRRYDWISKIR